MSHLEEMVTIDEASKDSVHPEDSASQVGSGTQTNNDSLLIGKAKAVKRKAVLMARAKLLNERHALQLKQFEVKQMEESFQLNEEIAIAEAEEEIYGELLSNNSPKPEKSSTPVSKERVIGQVNLYDSGLAPVEQNISNPDVSLNELEPEQGSRIQFTLFNEGNKSSDRSVPVSPSFHLQPAPAQYVTPQQSSEERIMKLQRDMLETLQLPKGEISVFDGNPLKYWTFVNSFDNNVGRTSAGESLKLNRLLQYCRGRALGVIECCAVMDPITGYHEARRLLKERFGNHHVIAKSWIDKIISGPYIRPTDNEGLRKYADDVRSCVITLQSMGRSCEIDTQDRMVKIMSKLPIYLQGRWRKEAVRSLREFGRYPDIEYLVRFIESAAEEMNDPVFGGKTNSSVTNHNSANFHVQVESPDTQIRTVLTCHLCFGDHVLIKCQQFKDMNPEERLDFVRSKRLCFNCFSVKHYTPSCPLDSRCNVTNCLRKHSKFLHTSLISDIQTHNMTFPESTTTACGATGAGEARVALPIVPVKVRNNSGQDFITTFALLDSGSTNTFCSQALLSKLQVKGIDTKLSLTTLGKENCDTNVSVISLDVTDMDGNNMVNIPYVFSTPNLPVIKNCIATKNDLTNWPHLRGIELPNIDQNNITLLIGQDVPLALIPQEIRSGTGCQPYATRTVFGWTLNGPLNSNMSVKTVANNFIQTENLDAQIENFWKLETSESLADNRTQMSINDKRVTDMWNKTTVIEGNHYQIKIPFKNTPPDLPNNYMLAQSRLNSLGKRLTTDLALRQKYSKEIDNLLDKSFAERVPKNEQTELGKIWYLPHHSVKNVNKPDKLRIVFDCSASYKNTGISLNSQVQQGPDLTNNLIGVLIRFREREVAIMGDIETMFHQVKVAPEDRDSLRFLWWKDGDPSKPIEEYRMTVHLFGGVWCPSCATYALRRTAEDNRVHYDSEVINSVSNNFYVDDCLKSVESETKAVNFVNSLTSLLKLGGFNLTKWTSNSRLVLETIPPENRACSIKELQLDKSLPTERALGVQWHTETDTFGVKTSHKDKPLTRRGVISIISSLYDPLGFICPFILQAKKIFQNETRAKRGWDEHLKPENVLKWNMWLEDCPKLEQFEIKRCVIPPGFGTPVKCELHHFSDASEEAYGSVSYLRVTNPIGHVHCAFLIGKSRLAPIKTMTIPRLELSAAVLSVRLDHMLRRELTLSIQRSVFWTDSTIVLQYIKTETKRFHTFVANRLSVIHDGSSPDQWRHVDSKNNPADDASRGLNATDMLGNVRWKVGPPFLWNLECLWPQNPLIKPVVEDKEVKREAHVLITVANSEMTSVNKLFERHSSWYNLKKSVAWILRFKLFLKEKAFPNKVKALTTRYLSVLELKNAENAIIRYVQLTHFGEEIETLVSTNTSSVKRSSPISSLEPQINLTGLLCVGGRLNRAPINNESKHQIILPKGCHIVNLIIRYHHILSGHSGTEYVLADIRRKFWIINGRASIKRELKRCVLCKRLFGVMCTQRMSDLPADRVTPFKPPFSNIGVDCFGPFEVKRGRSLVKRYGCLFTCMATRAIHIEKLDSMDTDSFINAFKRFESRRGRPESVRSDNGTNFVGGERELRTAIRNWNQQRISDHMLQREIKWLFNPPTASHMGGVWERQVRTVRRVLTSLLGKSNFLQDDDLATLFCEVEAIVNSRPITPVSDDPHDLEPLTPNHLLLLRSGQQLPVDTFDQRDVYRKRWRRVQSLADTFWKRWIREYLPILQFRQKWLVPKKNLKIGDVVLLMDNSLPRMHWPLGRVLRTFHGQDGLVRSVEIKTRLTTLTRPVHKLCLIETVYD